MENCFYVYLHRKLSDGDVFYVGKGKSDRAWDFNSRNRYWHNVKNKHGIVVEILFDNLSEEESLALEKDAILELRYFGYPLTNLTSGGESPKFTEDVKRRMSKSHTGKKIPPETVNKIVAFHTGRKRSEETCKRISEALKGKPISKERSARGALNRTGTKSSVADKTIYNFIHIDGTQFSGTRMELCEIYGVSKKSICKLFKTNPNNYIKERWGLIRNNEDKESALKRMYSFLPVVKDETEVFTFVNRSSGDTLGCTRQEMADFIGVSLRRLGALIYNTDPPKTILDWGVCREGESIEQCFNRIQSKSKLNKKDSTVYKFKHDSGEIFEGTRDEFSEYSLISIVKIKSLFLNNKPTKKTEGWSLYKGEI